MRRPGRGVRRAAGRLPWPRRGPYKQGLALARGIIIVDFQAARLTMVESQVRTNDVTDLAIQDAMRLAPRETLLPAAKAQIAYAEAEIEYAPGFI